MGDRLDAAPCSSLPLVAHGDYCMSSHSRHVPVHGEASSILLIFCKFEKHHQHTTQRWVTSQRPSVRQDRVLGDSRETALDERADEHVDGASRSKTTHRSICPPSLKSNQQSFREHKARSQLTGGRVGITILAPVCYSFHRRNYPPTSVLTSLCS